MPMRPLRHDRAPSVISDRRVLIPLAIVATGIFALGSYTLYDHFLAEAPEAYRASAGVFMLLAAAGQASVLIVVARRKAKNLWLRIYATRSFWRWLFVGLVVSYLIGLALGPDPAVRHFFRASLVFWYTVSIAPLLIDTEFVLQWATRVNRPVSRIAARAIYWTATIVVAAELSLRGYGFIADDRLPEHLLARGQTMTPGAEVNGGVANELGYWDESFQTNANELTYRIAALGDGTATLAGSPHTNCLNQLESRIENLAVYNFGLATAGPQEYAAQLRYEVAPYDPDLVLSFVSIHSDLHETLALPGYFDYRSLRILQYGFGDSIDYSCAPEQTDPKTRTRQEYLRAAARQTSVCRAPMPDHMRNRWTMVFNDLNDLVGECRRHDASLVLVLVPAPFQVDKTLRVELCRRAGLEPHELDLELPQRKLLAYAAQAEIDVIDLLPHFRAAREVPYARNDSRLNDTGNRITADVLCRWVQQRHSEQLSINALAGAQ